MALILNAVDFCTRCLVWILMVPLIQLVQSQNTTVSNGSQTVFITLDGDAAKSAAVNISFNSISWYQALTSYDLKWKVGSVICRQLGLGPPRDTTVLTYISSDPNSSIRVDCASGYEDSLSECSLDLNISDSQNPWYKLNVSCLPREAEDFDIALVSNGYVLFDAGIPMIFLDGEWGPICSDNYYDQNDDVCKAICQQAGYKTCSDTNYFWAVYHNEAIKTPPVIREVECDKGENLKNCKFKHINTQHCEWPEEYFRSVSCTDFDYFNYDSNDDYYIDYDTPARQTHVGTIVVFGVFMFVIFIGVCLYRCLRDSSGSTTTRGPQAGTTYEAASFQVGIHPPPVPPGNPPNNVLAYPPTSVPAYPHSGGLPYPPVNDPTYPPSGHLGYPPTFGTTMYPPASAPGYPPGDGGPGHIWVPPSYTEGAAYPPSCEASIPQNEVQEDPDLPTYEEVIGSQGTGQ